MRAHSAKYVCGGWEYDDGSKSNKVVKLIIEKNEVQVDGLPYSMAGNSFNLYKKIDEVFLVLNRFKMDGFAPARNYHIILRPCSGNGELSDRWEGKFDACKKHEMVRIEETADIMWQSGMQKTSCEIF